MWPFTRRDARAADKARDAPDLGRAIAGAIRPAGRVRGDHTLKTSEAIFAAVSRIANTVAMLPMHLYKNMEVQTEDWRERLVSYMPNATMSPFIFQQTMETYRNTEGNAYALLVPDTSGKPTRLDVLDAARVTPMVDQDSGEMYYQFTTDNSKTTMTVHSSSMIVLRHISANGARGIRPVDVLRGTLDYSSQVREFSLRQLEGVNSGIILNIPGTGLSKEKREAVINQFLEAYKESAGRVIVLEGGITATTLSGNPINDQALDVERITKNRVATVYCIPPHMLGDYSDANYSTAEQSNREYLTLTILPIVRQWEDEYNLKLLTWRERAEGYCFRFDLTEMMRADMATMAEANQKAIRGGWKTINEVRKSDGQQPHPMGDRLLISRDLMPLEQVFEQNNNSEGGKT